MGAGKRTFVLHAIPPVPVGVRVRVRGTVSGNIGFCSGIHLINVTWVPRGGACRR
jgi:hypothetical protein